MLEALQLLCEEERTAATPEWSTLSNVHVNPTQ